MEPAFAPAFGLLFNIGGGRLPPGAKGTQVQPLRPFFVPVDSQEVLRLFKVVSLIEPFVICDGSMPFDNAGLLPSRIFTPAVDLGARLYSGPSCRVNIAQAPRRC